MSSAVASSKLPGLTKDILDVAEILGVLLVAKLNDTLREAIASEADKWRTDALHILGEFRDDIQCRLRDSEVPAPPSNLGVLVPPMLSETSSSSSCLSLPLATFGRNTSLEQRLAANIFAAKYGERNFKESLERNGAPQVEYSSRPQAKAKCHNGTSLVTCDSLIPSDPSDQLSHELAAMGSHAASSSQSNSLVVAGISNSSTQASTVSQMRNVGVMTSFEVPAFSQGSPTSEASNAETGLACRPMQSRDSVASTKSGKRWQVEASKFYDPRSVSACQAREKARSMKENMFRFLGIIPWSMKRVLLSRLYQFAVLCCLLGSVVSVITQSSPWAYSDGGEDVFASHVDDVLAVGTILSFLAALWKNQALQDAYWLIESYLFRAGRLEESNKKTRLDMVAMSSIWFLCVGSRFYARAMAFSLSDLGFAVNILVLLAVCLYALQPCCRLLHMIDHFCQYMYDHDDFETALEEFFLLHCTIRTVCNSLELCFLVLLLTATGIFLFCSGSIYLGQVSTKWVVVTLFPGVLCEGVLLYLSMRAALVSDLCARVPMLVNSVNAKLETKKMYVVDHIVHCQAGFYIFEVRLSTPALLKISYVAFVAWCGLLSQGML